MENEMTDKKTEKPSKHSKKFFIITIIVIVIALGGSGMFAYKTWQIKETKKKQEAIQKEQDRLAAIQLAKKKADEARLQEAEKLKKEVAEIDVSEIKAAVADLKEAMASFKQ